MYVLGQTVVDIPVHQFSDRIYPHCFSTREDETRDNRVVIGQLSQSGTHITCT